MCTDKIGKTYKKKNCFYCHIAISKTQNANIKKRNKTVNMAEKFAKSICHEYTTNCSS